MLTRRGGSTQQHLRWQTGEGFDVPGEVGLIGVPGEHGDVGEGQPGAGVVEGNVHPKHAVEHLRSVAERVQTAAVELPLAQADGPRQPRDPGRATEETVADTAQYIGDQPVRGLLDQVGDLQIERLGRIGRRSDPVQQSPGPVGRPQLGQPDPLVQKLRNLHFHNTENDALLAYSKTDPATGDTVIVVVNLDTEHPQEGMVFLDLPTLGYDWHDTMIVHDEVTGATWEWGQSNYVRLDPVHAVAHVLAITR